MSQYRYTLKNEACTSLVIGNCMCCGGYVAAAFSQQEERRVGDGWTTQGCTHLIGHKECLESKQRINENDHSSV